MMTNLYYESHITIEPVFGERLEQFKQLAEMLGFRVADLLMQKRPESTPERSQYDSFCTSRDTNLIVLKSRMAILIEWLQHYHFQVWRYKIEDTLMDSRWEDVLGRINQEITTDCEPSTPEGTSPTPRYGMNGLPELREDISEADMNRDTCLDALRLAK